jgi:hypothetical protein
MILIHLFHSHKILKSYSNKKVAKVHPYELANGGDNNTSFRSGENEHTQGRSTKESLGSYAPALIEKSKKIATKI